MNELKIGQVVCRAHADPRGSLPERRGVVMPASEMRGPNVIEIRHSSGCSTVNPDPRLWQLLRPEQQTTLERVLSALWSWEPAEMEGDHGEMPWALMCALLTPTEMADVFPENGDWPSSYDELAVAIAHALDFREAARDMSFS